MADFVEIGGLKVNEELYHLVRDEIVPGTGVKRIGFGNRLARL